MSRKIKTIIFSAPSGGGKNAITNQLLARRPKIKRVLTCTTREVRPGEIDGIDYHFLLPEIFQAEVAAENFLEYNFVHGKFYGTRATDLEKIKKAGHIPLIISDVQGAMVWKKKLPAEERLMIFIVPESIDQLRQQILERNQGMAAEDLASRLETAKKEIGVADEYDFRVINRHGFLGETVEQIVTIIDQHFPN